MSDRLFDVRFKHRDDGSRFFDMTNMLAKNETEAEALARKYAAEFVFTPEWATSVTHTEPITDLEIQHGS